MLSNLLTSFHVLPGSLSGVPMLHDHIGFEVMAAKLLMAMKCKSPAICAFLHLGGT